MSVELTDDMFDSQMPKYCFSSFFGIDNSFQPLQTYTSEHKPPKRMRELAGENK